MFSSLDDISWIYQRMYVCTFQWYYRSGFLGSISVVKIRAYMDTLPTSK